MRPAPVSSMFSLRRRRRKRRIAVQPLLHHEVIKLLAPQQPRESLPLDGTGIRRKRRRSEAEELVRLRDPLRENAVEVRGAGGRLRTRVGQPCMQHARFARLQLQWIPGASFGSFPLRIYGAPLSVNNSLVKAILVESQIGRAHV